MNEPAGYAVVMADGHFVGIWRDKAIAETVCAKQPPSHGDRVVPMSRTPEWRAMADAPLDGTEIELLVRHFDYFTALKVNGKEEAERLWQGAVRGKWIDHNGGGWTWRGHAGSPVGWKPIVRTADGCAEEKP